MQAASPSLAHDLLRAPGATPTGIFVFVHGILGTRANWRGLARRVVKARPEVAALCVDLPMHGDSQGHAPPHGVEPSAEALAALCTEQELPVRAMLGHSFGGKVVLAAREGASVFADLDELWVVDSPPGVRSDGAQSDSARVIQMLGTLAARFAERADFVAEVMARGHSSELAHWLAMNLRRGDAGDYGLELDLAAIDAMLTDYFHTDAWPWLESAAHPGATHFIRGGRSQVYAPGEVDRLAELAQAGALSLHVVKPAGHWVHAEAPDAVFELLTGART